MASSQSTVQYLLKDRLIQSETVLSLLRKPRNLEAQRINCTAKEAKVTGKQFSM